MPSGFMCIKKYFQKQKLKKIVGFRKAIGVLSPPYLVMEKFECSVHIYSGPCPGIEPGLTLCRKATRNV